MAKLYSHRARGGLDSCDECRTPDLRVKWHFNLAPQRGSEKYRTGSARASGKAVWHDGGPGHPSGNWALLESRDLIRARGAGAFANGAGTARQGRL